MDEKKDKLDENYFSNKYQRRDFKFASRSRLKILGLIIVVLVVCYYLVASAPADFPKSQVVSIPNGTSLKSASNILEQNHIIRSPLIFRSIVRLLAGSRGVKAGDYLFESRQNVLIVAKRLTAANRGFAPLAIVIPEGTSVRQIADILSAKIPNFDSKNFLKIAGSHEGYLFPDTYHFSFDISPEEVLETMTDNFNQKIESLKSQILIFGRPLADVINMASIVEEEGRTTETRRRVAGILWKRLDIGMPLQVDASLTYFSGKNTFQLATSDLEIDSPYNTYTRKGLPQTPITNPGLDAITATITPIKTPYLYYLTGKDGVMYYAATHDQHVANKERYLK